MNEEYIEYETVVDMLIAHGFCQFSTPHGEMTGWETVTKMWMPYTPDNITTQLTPNQRMQKRAWGGMAAKLSLDTGTVYLKNAGKWLDFNLTLVRGE